MHPAVPITSPAARRQAATPHRLCAPVIALLMAAGLMCSSGAETKEPSGSDASRMEYQLKAAFLFNFAKFVQWPTTNDVPANHFRIGILDDGTVFPVISAALANKSVRARSVSIERMTTLRDARHVDLLFVARSQEGKLATVLKHIGSAPVLTVGETPHFARDGGCINLVHHEQNIRFEINLKAAERAGLKVSSKLASMATVVEPREANP